MTSIYRFGILMLLATLAVNLASAEPVKVYILSGQSNMVGIGQVDAGGTRWGKEFIDPVVSVYQGEYNPETNYDELEPTKTLALDSFGGVTPTPYPGGGTQITRGQVQMGATGAYEFRPGYGDSTHCIMLVDGKEVYRKTPGGAAEHTTIKLEAGKPVPFEITYLTAGANGLGWYARMDYPGTLNTVVKQQGKYPHLLDEKGNWAIRDDVWYKGVVTATANKWLSIGCGAGSSKVGPELGFGWVLGDYHDEPVLILKASQGNRSLAWDFLPPGSKQFEQMFPTRTGESKLTVFAGYKDPAPMWVKGTEPSKVNWYAGKQYDDCFNSAEEVLANFDQNFPMWKGKGFEIAGFVWWQGHKDSGNSVHRARYEANLKQLITSLRSQFKAPNAPFIVGTVGFGGWKGMSESFQEIAAAQLAISDVNKHPEYKGNVKSVETRGFWKSAEESPRSQDFHYHQNGEVYYQVGEAFGRGMVELLEGK